LIIPSFNNTNEDAKEQVTITEMREIQNSFRQFAADVMLKNNSEKMENILQYGLWPLLKESAPEGSVTYSDYAAETAIGRRGPYLRAEGQITIASGPTTGGQAHVDGGAVTIPIMKDPYGGYYRVMCPDITGVTDDTVKKDKLRRMVLVCTGPDKTLDTLNTEQEDDDIKVPDGKDDKVIRLMPLATY
ncbi:MAG: hypothetical protein PHV59_02795, partial [Victivallales bacterium]|nr:hypothetical protein [Victivallales bacterium]